MCSTMEVFYVPVLFMIFNIYEKKLNWFKTIKSSTLSANIIALIIEYVVNFL